MQALSRPLAGAIMQSLMRNNAKQFIFWSKHLNRTCSSKTIATEGPEKLPYNDLMQQRQQQATRSIVVQVQSEKSFPELYNYCASFGQILSAHHYRIQHEDDQHYILLEFASTQEASTAISASAYNDELSGVTAHSPFLWFRAASSKRELKAAAKSTTAALVVIGGTEMLDNNALNELLSESQNLDQQILLLHQRTQLNDLGVRLRFLAALQVQQAVSGMFPFANAQPFGSSVNGFGRMGCDLDLILRFDREVIGTAAMQRRNNDARLVFHTKENLTNGRTQTQRQMESVGDMLHLFLPGVCHVRRILQARVPIIKYHHEHLNLEVDLSMSNLTGFYMSELLYMFGEFDERVRPLTFCIRRWAQACGLTNPSPGRWITNFSLTCLVIFFLQQMKQPILPTINALMKSATPEDIRLTEDGINCSFARDLERIAFRSSNTTNASELLLQFFEFYSQFDFHNRAISLNEGRAIAKPDHSALYIVNPLEQVLNVSKNISHEECERLRIEVRNAAWVLESEVEQPSVPDSERAEASWGILRLFKANGKSIIRPNMFFKPRMVDVSELFDNSAPDEPPAPPVEYKNDNVKREVESIKAQARGHFRQMRMNASTAAGAAATTTAPVKTAKGRRSR
ncbi:PREDICTED: poly(A) RNA polymerase, mitochondrial [Rhagoletis zephyria]|uniref:poly(A) RNA polymerase, mitochondrial n=1 Tax=Rhagoletis zephyria TaxID=28612 RepID=UPI0008113C2E|nr:PREDICTED: poly(A) RNA polymerase, mitochondrial [Rhagoletis zephyria]XP_017470872.1 PREDICTED: poly(A) RNA polymerase, mitochondrial [Rhagoletis zephyria]